MTCSKPDHDRRTHGHPCVVCELEKEHKLSLSLYEAGLEMAEQAAEESRQRDHLQKELDSIKTILRDALKGCGKCDWDEAEGALFDHCEECCRNVTREAFMLVSGPTEKGVE